MHEMLDRVENYFSVKAWKSYRITGKYRPKSEPEMILGMFGQLARLEVLRGVLALEDYEVSDKKLPSEHLKRATKNFVRAFEYDKVISADFRDIERAQQQVYKRMRDFNINEVLDVFKSMKDMMGKVIPSDQNPLFWTIMERNFGPYDEIEQLAVLKHTCVSCKMDCS